MPNKKRKVTNVASGVTTSMGTERPNSLPPTEKLPKTRSPYFMPTQPVKAVNTDHQSTIRISTRRGPKRSPHQPAGTSNKA